MNSRSTIFKQYAINKAAKENNPDTTAKNQGKIIEKQSLGLSVISRDGIYLNRVKSNLK